MFTEDKVTPVAIDHSVVGSLAMYQMSGLVQVHEIYVGDLETNEVVHSDRILQHSAIL